MRRAVALALLLTAGATQAQGRDLEAVYYDFLLADYCALVTPDVRAGYEAQVAAAVERGAGVTAQQAAASAAELAFEREWGNRGLGGSRPWCRHEGAESAARLSAPVPSPDSEAAQP